MKRKSLAFVALGVASISALVTGTVAAAAVQSEPQTLAEHYVQPAVSNGADKFFKPSQIEAAWRAVVNHYPAALPAGDAFPNRAPRFFYPGDSRVFETGLPELIAARYWRCAWLNQENEAPSAEVEQKLELYGKLPAVAEHFDVETYESGMKQYAESIGVTPSKAEFDAECVGLYPGEK